MYFMQYTFRRKKATVEVYQQKKARARGLKRAQEQVGTRRQKAYYEDETAARGGACCQAQDTPALLDAQVHRAKKGSIERIS